MSTTPKNDRTNPISQFCLAMEQDRRTAAGRVRTAREMLCHFFPRSEDGAVDRIFLHLPQEVRGPIVASWGIRGEKSALRDSDERVRQVVADALEATDIDEVAFERGLSAQILIDWIPLGAWWRFWRSGKLTAPAIQKALATARSLDLYDDAWFLENIRGRGGSQAGIDTICESLAKDQIVTWLRKVQESGDGSAASLVRLLGWDVILGRTSQEALLFALDALARRLGLAPTLAQKDEHEEPTVEVVSNGSETEATELEFGDDGRVDEPADSGVQDNPHPRSYRPVHATLVSARGLKTPPPLPRRSSGFIGLGKAADESRSAASVVSIAAAASDDR